MVQHRGKQRNSIFACEGRCDGGNSSLVACVLKTYNYTETGVCVCVCVCTVTRWNGRRDADDKLQPAHPTHPLHTTCRTQARISDDRRIHHNCRNVSTFQWAERFVLIRFTCSSDITMKIVFLFPPPVPELTVFQHLSANYTSVN